MKKKLFVLFGIIILLLFYINYKQIENNKKEFRNTMDLCTSALEKNIILVYESDCNIKIPILFYKKDLKVIDEKTIEISQQINSYKKHYCLSGVFILPDNYIKKYKIKKQNGKNYLEKIEIINKDLN